MMNMTTNNNQNNSVQNDTQYPQSIEEPQTFVWPVIQELKYFDPPQFPIAAMPEPLRSYIVALSEATQTPVDLAALMVLSTVAAINAKFYIADYSSDWSEPLNLYIIVALPPASRKSAVFAACVKPLQDYEEEKLAQMKAIVASAESERRMLMKRQENLEKIISNVKTTAEKRTTAEYDLATCTRELQNLEVPALPRLIADDVTPEMLTSLLCEQNGKMAVMSSEGSLFTVIIKGLYSSGGPNYEILLKAHSGDTIRVDRRVRPPEYVADPALTIGLAIQPGLLNGLSLTPGLRNRGLLARFLYSFPKSNIGSRAIETAPVPENLKNQYNSVMRQMLREDVVYEESGYNPKHITLCAEAKHFFDEYRETIETRMQPFGSLSSIQDWAGKLAGAVLRVAANFQLVKNVNRNAGNILISRQTMLEAISIGNYFTAQALGVFDLMGADPVLEDAKILLSCIERRQVRSFTKREIHQAVRGQKRFDKATAVDAPLNLLAERGYIRRDSSSPNSYEVNPLILGESPECVNEDELPEGFEEYIPC